MHPLSRPWLMLLLVALSGLTLAGCGGKHATPKGRVLMNGQPYKFAEGETMSVTFSPTAAGGAAASANVSPDGSFTVGGEGLPPGSYKVNVVSNDQKYQDRLKGVFAGANTPLQIEVAGGSPTIVIDLGKKTVTKE